MQGAFPVGVDWTHALDPSLDEEAQRKQRSDQAELELIRLAQVRNIVNPPAIPRNLQYIAGPFTPSPFFHLPNGTKFYIMRDFDQQVRARPGHVGHYLVTTVVYNEITTANTPTQASRPFINPERVNPYQRPPPGSPGTTLGDTRKKPNGNYCLPGRDYTTPTNEDYHEIGMETLRKSLEQAEALDLAFARRMEGLGNTAPHACWECQDLDFDPNDRPGVRDQFLAKYMAEFYSNVGADEDLRVEDVSDEAVHKHKAFCQAWARRHYKTLTPAVTAPAEALTSEFFKHIEPLFHPEARLTRAELARLLMRHPETSAEFASCLHHYSTWLEQTRGGRNASYKQMSTTSNARIASYKRMGDFLGDKLAMLTEFLATLHDKHERHFNPYVTDWYYILGQMPQIHRHFTTGDSFARNVRRNTQNPAADGHVPPWRFGR